MRRLPLLVLFLVAPLASAQQLRVGEEIAGALGPESRDTYTFDTKADWYVYGHVNQLTVDVVVRILDPDGTEVGRFDSPARGPEPFRFSPKKTGTYTVEVAPYRGAEGDYVVLLIANEPKATDPAGLVDQLMAPFSGTDRPGAVISVLKSGAVVLARGYGMANLTYGVPMTEDTGMSVASVSKHFTGMAIVLLEQDGKLSLEDDVRKHLPELRDFGTPVTLRNLLNHTSGYREILNMLPMAGWNETDALSREEPIRLVQRQPRLQNEPGAEYNYNNTAFMLLATVAERASGKGFREFMEERIFRPLGMDRTTIKTHQGQVIPNSSQGYSNAESGGYRYVTDFASLYGASGVNTTAIDITKWMLNFRDAKVGGREAIERLTTRGILTGGDTTNYALGLGVRTWRGRTLFTHTGGETSHRTWFGYFPEIDCGLFFSSNNPAFGLDMWEDLAEAFFGEYLEPEADEDEPVPAGADPPVEPADGPAPRLEDYAGRYWSDELETLVTVVPEDSTLMAHHRRMEPFRLTHGEGDEFAAAFWAFGTFRFVRDPDGTVGGFLTGNGRTRDVFFRRLED